MKLGFTKVKSRCFKNDLATVRKSILLKLDCCVFVFVRLSGFK